MKVCDMCRKKIIHSCKVSVSQPPFNYGCELCGKCACKIRKYIKFEHAKHKHQQEKTK